MGNRLGQRWLTRLIGLCLLLILLCLLGHLIADATGVSVDALVALDLHGHFVQDAPLELQVIFAFTLSLLLIYLWLFHWAKPPTPPPPILSA